MDLDEEVREFLIECNENLSNLDREVVLLEQRPEDPKLIASVFRTFHTIKGTCGFFGFVTLGAVTHIAENILDQVRGGQRPLTPELTSLVLETVDAIKELLQEIEREGQEGGNEFTGLRNRLTEAFKCGAAEAEAPKVSKAEEEVVARELLSEEPSVKKSPAAEPLAAKSVAAEPVSLKPLIMEVAAPAAVVPTSASAGLPGGVIPHDSAPGLAAPPPAEAPVVQKSIESSEAPKNSVVLDSTIRVDVGLLDKLMNLVGELVLARNQLLQGTSGQDGVLIRTVQRLNVITSELQEGVLKTRMQPIGVVWNKLPRVIRDLAAECGKKINIEMEGAETELDKTIIEAIKDPLTHIVRNSCDHGVETPAARLAKGKHAEGLVMLRAYHEGGHVNIEISDDGSGLDPEKLKARAIQKGLIRAEHALQMTERDAVHLVFMPGFSTAEQVPNISG